MRDGTRGLLGMLAEMAVALGLNAVPALGVFAGGWPVHTAMVLYFFENVIGALLVAVRLRLLAPATAPMPAQDRAGRGPRLGSMLAAGGVTTITTSRGGQRRVRVRRPTVPANTFHRRSLIEGFLVFALGFSLGSGVLLMAMLTIALKLDIDGAALRGGTIGILIVQAVGLLADLVFLRPLAPERAFLLVEQRMGRVALLYLAVFVGVFLAAVAGPAFFAPFVILKTLADLEAPLRLFRFRPGGDRGPATETAPG